MRLCCVQRKYRGHRKTLLARTQLLQQTSIVSTTPTPVMSSASGPGHTLASTAALNPHLHYQARVCGDGQRCEGQK